MRVVVLACIFAGILAAAEEKPSPKLPPEIQQVVDLATAAPPEFNASALLRLTESGKIPKEFRRQVLVGAFDVAARAQSPYRLVAGPGAALDTRSAYQAGALRLGLDGLTLQSRAVTDMLAVDKSVARELFERMTKPALNASGCEQPLIPDVSPYYELLTRLASEVYTGGDGEKNSRLAFAQAAMDGIRSHVELAPAIQFINSVAWTPSQFEIVTGSLIGRLQGMTPDDRSFSWSSGKIEQAISGLVTRARDYNTSPDRIAEAYRAYLVANLHGPRCADNISLSVKTVTGEALELFGASTRANLSPLTADELKPKKAGEEIKVEAYWQSDEAKNLFEQCKALRTGPDGRNYAEAERSTREWKRQLSDFLNLLTTWKPAAEKSDADYFHQRAIVYEALLELTPPGDTRNRVFSEYLAFLTSSNLQQHSPVEWYWHIRSTVSRARATRPAEAQTMIAAFGSSGVPMLALEAHLERVAPDYSMFPQ